MTIQQEAYSRIDQMTDEGLKILIDMIDKMRTVSVTGFKNKANDITIKTVDMPLSKEEKKRMFLQSAGKIKIDADAVKNLRERSII